MSLPNQQRLDPEPEFKIELTSSYRNLNVKKTQKRHNKDNIVYQQIQTGFEDNQDSECNDDEMEQKDGAEEQEIESVTGGSSNSHDQEDIENA